MTRNQVSRVLIGLSALGFFIGAALHTSGYNSVVLFAQQGPAGLGALMAAVWLAFTAGMIVVGLIVDFVALRQMAGARAILVLAACFPLAAAALQLRFLGFIAPVAILSTIAVLSVAGAAVLPTHSPRLEPPGVA